MFDWIKNIFGWPEGKRTAPESLTSTYLGWVTKRIEQGAMLIALAKVTRAHIDSVNAGHVKYPAHKRRDAGVAVIWHDLRLEALSCIFNFGHSDPALLIDQARQTDLLRRLLDEQPRLEMPQPSGDVVPDTLRAVWQVYAYLSKVGSEVGDHETDRLMLKVAKKNIFDNLAAQARQLRVQWETFEESFKNNNVNLLETPKTLFEELFDDVTAKTKSIALSAQFGPNYEDNIKMFVKMSGARGASVDKMQVVIQRILEAKDPDELRSLV